MKSQVILKVECVRSVELDVLSGILILSYEPFSLRFYSAEIKVPVNLNTKVSATFCCCEIFVFIKKNISEIRIIA